MGCIKKIYKRNWYSTLSRRIVKYGYARVSTEGQDLERQMFKLKEYGIEEENIFYEKMSGMKKERPVLKELMAQVKSGDVVVVESLSRLARSTQDLWNFIQYFLDNGIVFVSLKESVDLSTATGKLLFTVLSGLVQFERDLTSERTKETLRVKKEEGMVLGRPTKYNSEQDKEIIDLYKAKNSGKQIHYLTGIEQSRVYRVIRKYKKEQTKEPPI